VNLSATHGRAIVSLGLFYRVSVTGLLALARAEPMLPGSFYIGAEGGWTNLTDVKKAGNDAEAILSRLRHGNALAILHSYPIAP
jgi:hypothetical protein